MYQALYRKWRPQTFDEVIGQQHITETLKNQVKTDRLSHAYIFIGTRGTGKTTCARILAKAVNCENPVDGNPCGKCASCRGISEGGVMDVVELDAASNNGVDNVRALRDEAVFSPANVKKRVYIIDEVHMLSTAAFNALLKILEEPPKHLMFILATTELQKVPATVLSRCQRHSFRRLDSSLIAGALANIAKHEGMDLSADAADLIARLAEGGMRDALSLLDQCSGAKHIDVEAVYSAMGLAGNRRTAELLSYIIDKNCQAALKSFNSLWMDGKDPMSLLGELASLMRDVLMLHVAPKGGLELVSGAYELSVLKGFADKLTREELICAMNTIQRYLSSARDSKNQKTTVELCLVSLCDNTAGESVNDLRSRISRLEEKLKNGIPMSAFKAEEEFEPYEYEQTPRREEYVLDEEDELDPMDFAEEQPEDILIERAAPAVQELTDAQAWKMICDKVRPGLNFGIAPSLDRPNEMKATIEGSVLKLQVIPGFKFTSFNKPDVLNRFAEAASEVLGREMRTHISELDQSQREKRSLDELDKFPEVNFKN